MKWKDSQGLIKLAKFIMHKNTWHAINKKCMCYKSLINKEISGRQLKAPKSMIRNGNAPFSFFEHKTAHQDANVCTMQLADLPLALSGLQISAVECHKFILLFHGLVIVEVELHRQVSLLPFWWPSPRWLMQCHEKLLKKQKRKSRRRKKILILSKDLNNCTSLQIRDSSSTLIQSQSHRLNANEEGLL